LKGERGGVSIPCQPAKAGRLAKILSQTRYGGRDRETRGQGKTRGPDIATSSNIGHLRSLPRIFPPLFPCFSRPPPLDLSPSPTIASVTSHYPSIHAPYFPIFTYFIQSSSKQNHAETLCTMCSLFIIALSRTLIPITNRSSLHQTCRTKHLGQ